MQSSKLRTRTKPRTISRLGVKTKFYALTSFSGATVQILGELPTHLSSGLYDNIAAWGPITRGQPKFSCGRSDITLNPDEGGRIRRESV